MILRQPTRIAFVLICCLWLCSIKIGADQHRDGDFKLTLFPFKVQHQHGKLAFRVKVRLTYTGKSPILLETYENLFVSQDAGFLQRSIYFGSTPELPLCSIRQVGTDQKYPPPISKTLRSGEVLQQEWVTDGLDVNHATLKGTPKASDGGVCLETPGKYQVKVVFWATNPKDKTYGYVSATSNEQTLAIPSP